MNLLLPGKFILPFSLLAALLWQSPAILRVSRSIKTDSFATLSPLGGFGLAVVTLLLVSILFLVNARLSEKIGLRIPNAFLALPVTLLVSFCLFVFFWAISPQIYYLYYQLLFDGLPWQLVVKDWFPFRKTLSLLWPGNVENSSLLAATIALVMLLVQVVLTFSTRKRQQLSSVITADH